MATLARPPIPDDLRAQLDRVRAAVGPEVADEIEARISRLEVAIAALQEANTRLAREHLGRHDAAAATVVGRLEQRTLAAEEQMRNWQQRFEYEQALALQHHQWMKALESKLHAPHHRAAEKLYQLLLRLPGMRLLFKLMS